MQGNKLQIRMPMLFISVFLWIVKYTWKNLPDAKMDKLGEIKAIMVTSWTASHPPPQKKDPPPADR